MATLNDQLINMGCSSRLAAFIRFDRFEFSEPSSFVKALAYQLASFDGRLAKVIADTIESRPQVLNHSRLMEQFQALILHPFQKCMAMRDEGPIVVLIDGLDECMQEPGGSNGFRQLLALFSDPGTFETIPFVRFIIASRPEQRIRQDFRHKKHVLHFPLDITSDETKADISHFLVVKFGEIYVQNPEFENLCTKLNAVECLSERASGLFIWAATIFRFVEGFPSEKRLKAALDLAPPPNALTALTDLYRTILDVIVDEADEDIKSLIRAVFGLLIASGKAYELSPLPNAPKLTPTILRDFLKKSGHDVGLDILPLLSKLGSVLPGELELNSDVFLLHKSLDDFLVDEERSGDWHVDVANHWSAQLAYSCVLAVHSMVLEEKPEYTPVFRYSSHFWVTSSVVVGWKGITSVPPFRTILLEMFQRHFLRWIYVIHSIEIPQVKDRAWIHSISGNLQESSKKLADDKSEGVVDLLDQITSFQYQLTRLGSHQLTLSRTLKVFFLFMCEAGSSSLLYKFYAPQFIKIANGSTDFMEIVVAIEEENALRSFSNEDGGEVKDQLEISGIPENDVKEMLEAACDRDLYQGGSDDEWDSRSFNDSASTFASV
ncbi:hypothetical protein L218DRAFT_506874 [Marasmius fiardii PR-910]|nr:hypothetical protein L218DRAFT_506874 [Marasmius fiardii PR-910]